MDNELFTQAHSVPKLFHMVVAVPIHPFTPFDHLYSSIHMKGAVRVPNDINFWLLFIWLSKEKLKGCYDSLANQALNQVYSAH